jgi:predicted aspartyl protease
VSNGSALALLGHVDFLGRPVVRLFLVGLQRDVLAPVDTGCNMHLLVPRSIADEAGFTNTGIKEGGELAAGAATFELFEGKIQWFGRERNIIAHVPVKEIAGFRERGDAPKVIIGTRLLRFSHLAIAFFEQGSVGSVRIHRNPTEEDE